MRHMSNRFSWLRRTAWIAVVTLILSAVPPAGAHRHLGPPGFDGHADFCSAAAGSATPATPMPADRGQPACTHCDGCAGHAGNGWALPPTFMPPIALRAKPIVLVAFAPLAPTPVEQIAARPRGPPHSA
jgi:hypothetical protein